MHISPSPLGMMPQIDKASYSCRQLFLTSIFSRYWYLKIQALLPSIAPTISESYGFPGARVLENLVDKCDWTQMSIHIVYSQEKVLPRQMSFRRWIPCKWKTGGIMEGRASPKRHSQSCTRHKLLQRASCSTICLVFTRLFICCFLPKPAQAASWSSSNKPSNSGCSDDDTIFFPLKYWQWVPPWSYIHSVLQPPKPKCWNKCPGEQCTASSAKIPPTDQNRQPSINIFTTWVPNKSSNCSTDSWIVILCHPNMEMSRSKLSTTLQPNMQ